MGKLGPALVMTLLLAVGVMGVRNALSDWDHAINAGQRSSTVLEGANGITSLAALTALFFRHRSARSLMLAWAVILTATAGAAARWWGEASVGAALVGAAATACVCALAIRLARPRLAPARTAETAGGSGRDGPVRKP